MLKALQFKERLVCRGIWLRHPSRYGHAQMDNVAILGDRSSLNGYGGIRRMLIGNLLELSVRPLKDHLPVGAALMTGFQEHCRFIGNLAATRAGEA